MAIWENFPHFVPIMTNFRVIFAYKTILRTAEVRKTFPFRKGVTFSYGNIFKSFKKHWQAFMDSSLKLIKI
jgi:hypothetical protein